MPNWREQLNQAGERVRAMQDLMAATGAGDLTEQRRMVESYLTRTGKLPLIETVTLTPDTAAWQKMRQEWSGREDRKLFTEMLSENGMPGAIYPDIRAITANKRTRNDTYYPAMELIGDPARGTGIHSILYPYPIPIIRDHRTQPTKDSYASEVFGRARFARFISDSTGGGYVSLIPEITDPWAVEGILTGRLLTVSIGVEAEAACCSLCGANQLEVGPGGCGHDKGQLYVYNGRETPAFWKIGGIGFRETSFVVVPSDDGAGVLQKDIGAERLRVLVGQPTAGPSRASAESAEHSLSGAATLGGVLIDLQDGGLYRAADLWHPSSSSDKTQATETASEGRKPSTEKENPMPDTAQDQLRARVREKAEAALAARKPFATIKDARTLVEFPVHLHGTPAEMAEQVKALPLLETEQTQVASVLVRRLTEAKAEIPSELAEVAAAETEDPAAISVDEANYPVLYKMLEEQQAAAVQAAVEAAVAAGAESVETFQAETRTALEGINAELETVKTQAESAVAEATTKATEAGARVTALETELTETKALLETAREDAGGAAQIAEAEQKLAAEQTRATGLHETVGVLQEQTLAQSRQAHRAIAEQVALVKKLLRKPDAKEKTVAELATALEGRSRDSLKDTLNDLMQEANLGPQIDVAAGKTQEAQIPSPVLTEDQSGSRSGTTAEPTETSRVVADPKTGKPTIAGGVTETEEENGSTVLVFGMSSKSLQDRIADQKRRMGL